MKSLRTAGLSLAALSLTACTTIGSVPAGSLALGGGQSVMLGRNWADVSKLLPQRTTNVRVLSIDGPMLNRLYLAEGLAPGEGLLKPAAKEKPVPVFRTDMSPNELVEFISDSVAAAGYRKVEAFGLRPARFGSADAFRFDLAATTPTGLETSGAAKVGVVGGKLYAVLFLAPSEHYFSASIAEVATIMEEPGPANGAPASKSAKTVAATYAERMGAGAENSAPVRQAEAVKSPPRTAASAAAAPRASSPGVAAPPKPCGMIPQPGGFVVKFVPCKAASVR